MNIVKKIYPSHYQLQSVSSCVPCPEEGCLAVFSSESNLNLHLVKTHKKEWDPDSRNRNREYYCPSECCPYNITKYFKTLKQLKQHYLKVHGDKIFVCEKCNKGFSTLAFRNRHSIYCGINFKCCECETSYPVYESLITHSRRKKHKILEKYCYNPAFRDLPKSNSGPNLNLSRKESYILPKAPTSLQLLNELQLLTTSPSFTYEKGSQTDCRKDLPQLKSKHTQVSKKKTYRIWSSKHSQTSDLLKLLASVETQTIGDYKSKKQKICNGGSVCLSKSEPNVLQKTTETQTRGVDSKTKSCNTTFLMNESKYDPLIQRSSSSTQTTKTAVPVDIPYSTSTSTHDSIHTDTSDLNFLFMRSNPDFNEDLSNFDSTNYLNCNMETQTDFMFDNDVFNMETQTVDASVECDDFLASLNYNKVDDVPLSNMQTQTIYDYLSCSVESQTKMSAKLHSGLTVADMANIQTQTEIDLKLLLESINA